MAGDADGLVVAQLAGAAARHASSRSLSADQETAALAELREIAAGRSDLLAQEAGLALGFGEAQPDADRYRRMAELLLKAGADAAVIPRWVEVGRDRARSGRAKPYAGPEASARGLLSIKKGRNGRTCVIRQQIRDTCPPADVRQV